MGIFVDDEEKLTECILMDRIKSSNTGIELSSFLSNISISLIPISLKFGIGNYMGLSSLCLLAFELMIYSDLGYYLELLNKKKEPEEEVLKIVERRAIYPKYIMSKIFRVASVILFFVGVNLSYGDIILFMTSFVGSVLLNDIAHDIGSDYEEDRALKLFARSKEKVKQKTI